MKLFIAEKPSLARQIINSLEQNTGETFYSKQGYYESNSYIVSFCFGFLYELKSIDEYEGVKKSWKETKLPYIPRQFEWSIKPECVEQVNILKKLLNQTNITEIVHCGDADSMGEVLVRQVILFNLKKTNMTVSRLWASDTTEETLWKAYKDRKDDSEYDNFYSSGLSQLYSDWLLGINATRALTVQANTGSVFNIGRVITPIVQKVVEREEERSVFKVKKSYGVGNSYCHSKTEVKTKKEAEVLCKEFNEKCVIGKLVEKERIISRPNLYSQTTLQNEVSKLGIAPDKCLSICQKLYEKSLLTYPRTNSEYLTTNEIEKVKNVLSVYGSLYATTGNEKCYNNSKVESHSAIIPTGKKACGLKKEERVIYDIVEARFLQNFFIEECVVVDQSRSVQTPNGETLTAKGLEVKQNGWNKDIQSKPLPSSLSWEVEERKTTKPSAMTVSSLNSWCEHPYRDRAEDEYSSLAKGLTIGTPATRAGIIKKAIETGYLQLEKQTYKSTDKGREMVKVLKENNIPVNAELSVQLQSAIQAKTTEEVLKETIILVNEVVESMKKAKVEGKRMENREMAQCVWCGEPIVKIKSKDNKVYWTHPSTKDENGNYVKEVNCSFFIGQDLKYFGQTIHLTEKQLDTLVKKGSVNVKNVPSKFGEFEGEMFIEKEPNVWNGKEYIQVNFKNKKYLNK